MKTKDRVKEFLEEIGYELGYNEKLLPDIKDLIIVEKYCIPVWEYMGYRTKESFYTRESKALHIKEIINENNMLEQKYWSKEK